MNWRDEYERRLIDIPTAIANIKSNDNVVVAMCASEPQGCMSQFHTVADRVENVRVFSCLTLKPYDFYMKPEMRGHFELASWF
ncbi:MAG: 4-hydroxybutyrate--acetyl-CoA CoA transferase, partial [Rectinemataceae bacterium]